MKSITLYFVVSGATYFNQLDRFQGWSGTPLTPAGQQASVAVGQKLAAVKFDTAYASDTSRGGKTGHAVLAAQATTTQLQLLASLRAPFYGGFEGFEQAAVWSGFATKLGYPSVAKFEADQTPMALQNLIHDHDVDSLAESGEEFWQRYRSGLAQVTAATPADGNVLVVTDSMTLRHLIFQATGEQPANQAIAPSTVTVLTQAGDKWTVRQA
ncbi:histidine phosphatase family protein [Lactiplantibacillus fabifermentans]|nr:histidine phosphatase family protein [Lactiplantibacillus fabifermentans]